MVLSACGTCPGQLKATNEEMDFQPNSMAIMGSSAYLAWKTSQNTVNSTMVTNRAGKASEKKPMGQKRAGDIKGARQASKKKITAVMFTVRKNPFVNSRKNFNAQCLVIAGYKFNGKKEKAGADGMDMERTCDEKYCCGRVYPQQ